MSNYAVRLCYNSIQFNFICVARLTKDIVKKHPDRPHEGETLSGSRLNKEPILMWVNEYYQFPCK